MSIWRHCWPTLPDGKASSHSPSSSWHGCPGSLLGCLPSYGSKVLYTSSIHGEQHSHNQSLVVPHKHNCFSIEWLYAKCVCYRFNYRATAYMVQHGFYNFLNWFDERAWYPLGRIVGGTVYPGLMVTSGAIHYVLHALNIPVHIRDICVFLAPIFR